MNPHDDLELEDFERDVLDGRYEPPATLDGPGVRFHGHQRHQIPKHVWQAIRDAAQRVLDNYTRVGTPCGHAPWREGENYCAVMICPHVLPSGTYEVTRTELAAITHPRTPPVTGEYAPAHDVTLAPGQRYLTHIYPELNITCSHCASPRGRKCTSPNGRSYSPSHESRRKTWHSTPEDIRQALIDRND